MVASLWVQDLVDQPSGPSRQSYDDIPIQFFEQVRQLFKQLSVAGQPLFAASISRLIQVHELLRCDRHLPATAQPRQRFLYSGAALTILGLPVSSLDLRVTSWRGALR